MARRLYERALSIWEKSLGADHPKVATGLVNLARFYLGTGNYADAGPLLDRALAIQLKGLGPEHPDVAVTLSSRAELAAHTGAHARGVRDRRACRSPQSRAPAAHGSHASRAPGAGVCLVAPLRRST